MPLIGSGQLSIVDVNDGLNSFLSNESCLIAVETDGSGGDFSSASTTISVLLGAVNDTANWVISAVPGPGVVGSLTGATYAVTSMVGDTGYVDLSASRTGFPTLTNRFTITKAKRGNPGPAITIAASASAFTYVDNVATPATQTIALRLLRQNATLPALWYASNGSALTTDQYQIKAGSLVFGMPDTGVGDTCYVTLANIGALDQLYITAVSGNETAVFCITKAHRSTSDAGATRNVFRGNWASGQVYTLGDVVLDGGSSWSCFTQHISSSLNEPPAYPATSNAFWNQYASKGDRGTIQAAVATTGTAWSDAEANAAIVAAGGVVPVKGDVVTLYNSGISFSQTRVYSGGVWNALAAFFGGDVLVDGTIIGNKLAASTILGDRIAAGTILATNLVVGDTSNIFPDPMMADPNFYSSALSFTRLANNIANSGGSSYFIGIAPASGPGEVVTGQFQVEPGQAYYAGIMMQHVSGGVATASTVMRFYTDQGGTIQTGADWPVGTATSQSFLRKFSKSIIAPSDARSARLAFQQLVPSPTRGVRFTEPVVRRASQGELIVDGTITANLLNTTSAVITGTAQIADAIITDAKVSDLSAAKLTAGTALAGSITVNGSAIDQTAKNAAIQGYGFDFSTNDVVWTPQGGGSFALQVGQGISGSNAGLFSYTGASDPVLGALGRTSAWVPIPLNTAVGYAGKRIRVSVTAKQPASSPSAEFAALYHTAGSGNSGWVRFTPTTTWQTFVFYYTVGAGVAQAANLAIWGDTSRTGLGVLISNITIDVSTEDYASDPGTRINSQATQIDPGKILISGATTLSDWRNGADNTKIEGGNIAANTISANKIEIGSRNITIAGIAFSANAATNVLSWTAGNIVYTDDTGAVVSQAISAGSAAAWTSGTQYVYWTKDATVLTMTTTLSAAMGATKLCLASYQGASKVTAEFGRTIIDGDSIQTGSIKATHLNATDLGVAGLSVFGGTLRSSNFSAGSAGWQITDAGDAEFNSLVVRQDMIVDGAVSSRAFDYYATSIVVDKPQASPVAVSRVVTFKAASFIEASPALSAVGIWKNNVTVSITGVAASVSHYVGNVILKVQKRAVGQTVWNDGSNPGVVINTPDTKRASFSVTIVDTPTTSSGVDFTTTDMEYRLVGYYWRGLPVIISNVFISFQQMSR